MDTSLSSLFVLTLLSLISVASSTDLLVAAVTSSVPSSEAVLKQTITINITTGEVSFLNTNFLHYGNSATVNGISTFDQKRKIFYFTTNSDTAWVFASDLSSGYPLPPLDLGVLAVYTCAYDSREGYVFFHTLTRKKEHMLYAYDANLPTVVEVANLTDYAKVATGQASVVSPDERVYRYVTYDALGAYFITSYNLETKSVDSKYINCNVRNSALIFMFYDTKQSPAQLYGLVEGLSSNTYFLASLDASTGGCTARPFGLQTNVDQGLVVAAGYSRETSNMYLAVVPSVGNSGYVCTLNVYGKEDAKCVQLDGFILQDLEVLSV